MHWSDIERTQPRLAAIGDERLIRPGVLRDPRILVHSIVTSRDGGEGEFKIRGTACPEDDPAVLRRYAGTVASSLRVRMINATPNPFSGHRDTGKALQEDYDNYIWNNCMDALIHQAGNPQVRAGVLRLLSTVPEVTVTSSTTNGRATLTLTASPALFAGLANQVLTIDAKTGIPISTTSTGPGGQQAALVTYQISRVTVADIAAGKFR